MKDLFNRIRRFFTKRDREIEQFNSLCDAFIKFHVTSCPVDLTGSDLRGADLSNIDLRGADLSGIEKFQLK